jgi:hypothetical protein
VGPLVPFQFWGGSTLSSIGGTLLTTWVSVLAVTPAAIFSDGLYSFLTLPAIPSIGEKSQLECGDVSERNEAEPGPTD